MNPATVLVCAALLLAVGLAVYFLRRKHRKRCSGGCEGCSMHDLCHK